MKIEKKQEKIVISDENFEVQIYQKIFGGYIFKKFIKNSPFDLLELREIRIDISEDEAITLAKQLLKQVYSTTKTFAKFKIQPSI